MADTDQIREDFDAFYTSKWSGHPGFWLDWYAPHLGLYVDLLRYRNRAIEAALPSGMGVALDCGCGAGDVTELLTRHARKVVAIDVSPANVEQTTANMREAVERGSVEVLLAPAEALPFPDGSFDAAVLADVIEHIPDRGEALREIARVLRPGGRLIVVTPDKFVLERLERLDSLASQVLRTARRGVRWLLGRPAAPPRPTKVEPWEEFLDRSELVELVTTAGFAILEHRNVSFYPGPEGGGVFAYLLALTTRIDGLREQVIEPSLRRLFSRIEQLEFLNQKQMVIAERRTDEPGR